MENKVHENDDLWYALEFNHPQSFLPEDIKDIMAEVPGENDEFSWWWILKLGAKKYTLLEGSCDYTGWDCQSSINEYPIVNTAIKASQFAPIIEDYSKRAIQPNLIAQLKGQFPKFTYWGEK
jgi:hypothetical protein